MEFIKVQKGYARDYAILYLIDYFKKFDFHIRFFKTRESPEAQQECEDVMSIELTTDFWSHEPSRIQETCMVKENYVDTEKIYIYENVEGNSRSYCRRKNFNFILSGEQVFVLNYPMTDDRLSFYFYCYSLDTFLKKYDGDKLYIQDICICCEKKIKLVFSVEKASKLYNFCLKFSHILFGKELGESAGGTLPDISLHVELVRVQEPSTLVQQKYKVSSSTNMGV